MKSIDSVRSVKKQVANLFEGDKNVNGIGISADENQNHIIRIAVNKEFDIENAPTECEGVKIQYKVTGEIKKQDT